MIGNRRVSALVLWIMGPIAAAQTSLGDAVNKPRVDIFGDPLPTGAILRLGTVRWRPSGSIQHLAFAPDGKRLASWHEEQSGAAAATIWDVDSGRELSRVELPGVNVRSWNWLADDRGIGVIDTSEGRYVWEFSDTKTPPPHRAETGGRFGKVMVGGQAVDNEQLAGFAVSPDGKRLAAGKSGALADKERDLVVWELTTQRRVGDLPPPRRLSAVPNGCQNLFFTPDGSKLVAFCRPADQKRESKEYLIAVLDAATGKELRRFTTAGPLQQGSRMSCALSARYLALGVEDANGTVLLWDLDGGQDQKLASGHGKKDQFSGFGVSALAFSENGKTLITAGRDGAVRTWDVAALQNQRVIADAYPGWIETLALTRDGKRLACAGQNGIIRHWDLTTGAELGVQGGHSAATWGASITPDGTLAVTSGGAGRLHIWDATTSRPIRIIAAPAKVGAMAHPVMAPDGRTVVAGVADKLVAWNAASGQAVPLPELPADLKIASFAFSHDGKTLLARHPGTVTLLDWPSGKQRRRFVLPAPLQKPGETACDAATLSSDGRWLATLSHRYWYRDERGLRFGYASDGVLDLWNAETGERVHRLVDGNTGRNALFTATGDLLCDIRGNLHPFAGDADIQLKGEFHLIDPATGRLKQAFEPAPALPGSGHRYNAAMGIAPDGRSIYCAGNDGVIHIYEAATGKIRRSLVRHRDFVSALSFTADGRRMLSASLDLTALVWDISLAGFATNNNAAPAREEQSRFWDQLSLFEAKSPYEAMAALAAHPPTAVALIRGNIKPVASAPTDATMDRLVAELGNDKFAVRERGTRELDELGEAAVAGIRARIAKPMTLETHRRLVRFLDKHDPAALSPVALREIRALEILEQVNNSESRTLLAELAKGAPNARLTRAAANALTRQK